MMAKPVRSGFAAAAVALAFICGSGDAFVVAVAGGRQGSGRTARAAVTAFAPGYRGSPRGGRSADAMAVRASLPSTPSFRGKSPTRGKTMPSSCRLGFREVQRGTSNGGLKAVVMNGDAVAQTEREDGGAGKEEVVTARCRRFSRPAAVFRFVREALEHGASKAGKGTRARIADWRRRMSLAFIGVAAALVVMTASAGPAQALFGMGGGKQEAAPQRLTDMPERVYVQREQLQEFCKTPQHDRMFDFRDLTVYEEELDELDMFADKVAPCLGARESFRLKYITHAEDYADGEAGIRRQGIYGLARFGVLGTLGLIGVGTVVGSFLWTCRAFLNMAREEEVFLYGEEISVDATEKEDEELDDLDEDIDVDEEDMEDYSVPPKASESGDGADARAPSSPPSDDGGAGNGGGGGTASDEEEDLLGL